ncbi:MAG TPA: NAD-dependent epimerase/dehydratase family protein [Polyangiaceae bacterium]|jgi:nucleoside-diphosphate-sugar epimerase
MPSEAIAITGASGFIGGAILARLRELGVPVVGLFRPGRGGALPPTMRREVRGWNEVALRSALDGVGVVVHAASVVHRPGVGLAEHRAFNVEGTRSLIAAARGAGVRRVVFLSTIKVYGEAPTGIIDENTVIDGSSPYAATKHDAEQALQEAAVKGDIAVVIFRLCPVYGTGDKGNVRRMTSAIARRRFVVPGDGATRKSIVHVSTVVEAVRLSLRADIQGTFVLSDRAAPSIRELADTIASVLGRRRPPSIPIALVLAAAAALESGARMMRRSPTTTVELVRKSLRSTVCSPTRVERALGIECHVDLRHGVEQEVSWLRREGLL